MVFGVILLAQHEKYSISLTNQAGGECFLYSRRRPLTRWGRHDFSSETFQCANVPFCSKLCNLAFSHATLFNPDHDLTAVELVRLWWLHRSTAGTLRILLVIWLWLCVCCASLILHQIHLYNGKIN